MGQSHDRVVFGTLDALNSRANRLYRQNADFLGKRDFMGKAPPDTPMQYVGADLRLDAAARMTA